VSNIACKPCDLAHQCIKRSQHKFCTTCLYFERIGLSQECYICIAGKEKEVDISKGCPPIACKKYEPNHI
jgi:hypothetical protein